MTIAAVVVTFNRLNLLKECIESIRRQTRKVDEIIVVNNSSTDGTLEWLNRQKDITVITQENSGSAGGQYTGIKTAYEKGHDWIWCMDDDVEVDEKCLENLLEVTNIGIRNGYFIFLPDRKLLNSSVYWHYGIDFNFRNPFRSESINSISVLDFKDDFYQIVSIPFEGPLIHKTVIEIVGNVDKNFFICYDDTDYSVRVYQKNIKIALVKKALLIRKNVKKKYGIQEIDYYRIRNSIYLDKKYAGNLFAYFRAIIKIFITLIYSLKRLGKWPVKNIKYLIWGFVDGKENKLGILRRDI